ncbi:colicin E3/pyocin S6 family cytotoxin [Gordonia sp. L191]|uniref:colicin E3/pyocin S6 family cytotoxin n=1 Tax=Gordonia sp. L191 TaxID=2982699 RepID=UPI0024C02518|nr:colicin E3/pyocin S6 family cytotoxin [Gordonia sp. L191]WHU45171.1 colicin E3/pyocin S6 family cytotoxin [Gordonia sp. L191]
MGDDWPSHKAVYIRNLLCDRLGYQKRRSAKGVFELSADGMPDLVWSYPNKMRIAPRTLRQILLEEVGLSEDEARWLLARPDRTPSGKQIGGQYIARSSPDFLDSLEVLPNRVPKQWRASDGRLFTYDQLHGNIEGYNRRGKHIGVFDVDTGERIGPAEPGRSINV